MLRSYSNFINKKDIRRNKSNALFNSFYFIGMIRPDYLKCKLK